MMYLHEDMDRFRLVVNNAANVLGIWPYYVEKDYYICAFLGRYMQLNEKIMFKGGTALSKGWEITRRFSEDIDINLRPDVESTDSSRMRICNTCKKVLEEMSLTWLNPERIGSRREFNRFNVPYAAQFGRSDGMRNELQIELVARKRNKVKSTTCIDAMVSSYIWQAYSGNLRACEQLKEYGLAPFKIPVQNLDVTFVEKCLSLANHYITNTPERVSRHLYDIHCMWHFGNLSTYNLQHVIEAVKMYLKDSYVDKALRGDQSFKSYLVELLCCDFYYNDFVQYTESMKMRVDDGISYFICKETLWGILSRLYDF